ncbi:hypothetical protein TGPRC2_293780 [Toxoplasma gondii TgCatPRC2]|uniref:Uncharacterized protein n=14 Tax=Toxoplasma gondii TaxID=5811 RepID=B9PY67_TOXGV|nr:hypothetical protein TGME49_293780 [Toxoplasma gondii ME49]EPR57607.1 hypothetical protein TGGT1_293780 [Toxoplasma gondii GT1]ESS29272.1 hypothetical protein TGVEG_293780 [Toxoplasma gondii VEG]KAF4646120.1 hypothetical protein TGRH88_019070 [Toxoplasma gondii]KFG31929.1 hypothetical protein TGDOM2_293780 [Toxoplasma gondii GAB2-2007-GAL-DOM2]KFG35693.1 hypothetical protein TGP89_293780 [Toxoplasma gondii p89]KFG47089.1 hypothetical protein TGFOU_293780 [Toxoplasma gondii FOU]KFG59475.1 |eukprot:XP_002370179.1 hypothetical protein TGME49_293780 [Toxoplasma gondii ME49]
MVDVDGELVKVEETRRKVEKELEEIRDLEKRIRNRQLEYSERQKKSEDDKNLNETRTNRGRLLADALSLYEGGDLRFDQSLLIDAFRDSEIQISQSAISNLFRWLERTDINNDEDAKDVNLQLLRATLAVMSGLRKHKWVELVELHKQVCDSLPARDDSGKEPTEKRNRLLNHIDDYLVMLERLRRLHWKEVEYLDNFGLQLQRGAFSLDKALQDYMHTTLLNRGKTYSGRYGFHNRSISTLDQLRRYYVDLRASQHTKTNVRLWEDLRIVLSAYDGYKAFTYVSELEGGVAAGLWPVHALPLFLY